MLLINGPRGGWSVADVTYGIQLAAAVGLFLLSVVL